jgi:cobalamin biosynthesis protein CbiD
MSTHALALRRALERAIDAEAVVTTPTPTRIRITITLPVDIDEDRWRAALHAVQSAPEWGSSDVFGGLTIWAELDATEGAPT